MGSTATREMDDQTSMATRFLYQPQAPQTVWGSLAAPQRGHRLREGDPSFQAPARWLRVFDFDFFFLGTATAISSGRLGEDSGDSAEVPLACHWPGEQAWSLG